MAAINLKTLDGVYAISKAPRVIGTGAIAAGDTLISDIKKYPIGTHYSDLTNRTQYVRQAVAGVIGDWCVSGAYTTCT
jgi:hypothetical protein